MAPDPVVEGQPGLGGHCTSLSFSFVLCRRWAVLPPMQGCSEVLACLQQLPSGNVVQDLQEMVVELN